MSFLPTSSSSARPSSFAAERLDERDAVLAVEADDAGRDARQHRLHEVAPFQQLLVGRHKRFALVLQFARHRVEGAREAPQIALAALLGQLHRADCRVETCCAATIRRRMGATKRPANHKPDPDRGQHRGHRDHDVHEAVRELQPAARFAQAVELVDVLRGELQMLDHLRADAARDVEILARILVELGDRRDAVAMPTSASAAAPGQPRPGAIAAAERSDVGQLVVGAGLNFTGCRSHR